MQCIIPPRFRLPLFWALTIIGTLMIQHKIIYCYLAFMIIPLFLILVLQINYGWIIITFQIWVLLGYLWCTQHLSMYWSGPLWISLLFVNLETLIRAWVCLLCLYIWDYMYLIHFECCIYKFSPCSPDEELVLPSNATYVLHTTVTIITLGKCCCCNRLPKTFTFLEPLLINLSF